jgi:tetratricopeptide (TPR) repeat protein
VDASRHAYLLRDRLPELERLQTTAQYQMYVPQDLDGAAATYRQLLALDPHDDIALNNLSELLGYGGRDLEAADSLVNRSLELSPGTVSYLNAMYYELALGRVQQAYQSLERLEEAYPGSFDHAVGRALLDAGLAHYDSAAHQWVAISLRFREPAQQAEVRQQLAALNTMQGMLTAAEREVRAYQAVAEQRGDTGGVLRARARLAIGYALVARDTGTAIRTLNDALLQYPLHRIAPNSRPYFYLIMAAAATGQVAQATRWLDEYRTVRPDEMHNFWGPYLEGQIALAQHKPREAAAELRQMTQRLSYCYPCGVWELGLVI